MLRAIDNFLDRITMYRLVLCYLIFLIGGALLLASFNLLPYSPLAILYSTLVLTFAGLLFNKSFSYVFKVPANVESVYITALILSLIISPPQVGEFISILPFLLLAVLIAVASKFLLSIGNKHIFNPAAIAVFLTIYVIGQSASWWVGTLYMLPLVLFGGLLMVRKLREFHLVAPFFVVSLLTTVILSPTISEIPHSLYIALTYSSLFFFAFVMLTEPLTMPYTKDGRIAYGILVGMLFNPQVHIGPVYFSPEMALLIGNIFAYAISPKGRFVFVVEDIKKVSGDILDFVLRADKPIKNKAGQYMEWTLPAVSADNRGNRRYFTLASSPTEKNARLGVKFYPNSSSYKNTLAGLSIGDKIVGGQLSGDFVLPKEKNKKLVFLAGGIGVTPFRSMIKYLIDKSEKRDIVMIYSNKLLEEIAYREIFEEGEKVGVKTIYTLSETEKLPQNWEGERGFINDIMIKNHIPDFKERTFYISGSHNMVTAFKDMLKKLGVSSSQIKTDFFPGLV